MAKNYINRSKLRSAIVKSKETFTSVAKEIGIEYQGLYRRFNGQDFTETEIALLVKKFGDDIIK